jgi:hypothetical protein
MQHPLVNASITPYGYALYPRRLEFEAYPGYINPERIIAQHWEKRNRLQARGKQPIRQIIHETHPELTEETRVESDALVFDGLKYLERDILVLSTAIQWLGTNVGNSFLERKPFGRYSGTWDSFEIKYKEECPRYDPLRIWTHKCNEKCCAPPMWSGINSHTYDPRAITARDKKIAAALMSWLGSMQGQIFIEEYVAQKKEAERTSLSAAA